MSIIADNKEKTINECLKELDETKIKDLFNKIPKEFKSKNKRISTKEKIECIEKYITTI